MCRLSITATAMLLALVGCASAETVESETVGQFLLSIPIRSVDPVIDHCSERVPEVKDDLLEERAGFIAKLAEAGKQLTKALENDPEFHEPLDDGMRRQVLDANSHALGIVEQQDPETTCRTILANMQRATVDELRGVVEATYLKFRDDARAED